MTKQTTVVEIGSLRVNPFSPADQQNTCANSVDPDEMACNELSHLDVHCLPFYFDV